MNFAKSSLAAVALAIVIAGNAFAAMPSWTQGVIEKVAAHRTTPRSAQLRGATGIARMEVDVDGRGMIIGYRLVKSSGVPILDHEADLILLRVGSFSPPPDGMPERIIIPICW